MADFTPVTGNLGKIGAQTSGTTPEADGITIVNNTGVSTGGLTAVATGSFLGGVSLPRGAAVYLPASGPALAVASAPASSQVAGLMGPQAIVDGLSAQALISSGETIKMTTAEWDAITGQVGGLTPNTYYYLSATTPGHLTSTAPSAGGTTSIRVGLSSGTRSMIVRIGDPFLNNG